MVVVAVVVVVGGVFFLTCVDFSKGRMFELCESYPRIIPPNHTQKNHDYVFLLGSFGIALASLVLMDLTS